MKRVEHARRGRARERLLHARERDRIARWSGETLDQTRDEVFQWRGYGRGRLSDLREAIGTAFLIGLLTDDAAEKAEAILCLEGAAASYLATEAEEHNQRDLDRARMSRAEFEEAYPRCEHCNDRHVPGELKHYGSPGFRWACAWTPCVWCNGEATGCPCDCHEGAIEGSVP